MTFFRTVLNLRFRTAAAYLLPVFMFLNASEAFAQEGCIRGRVIDAETGSPLIGATVVIEGRHNGTTTDEHGDFIFENLDAGTYRLTTSYLSYKTDITSKVVSSGIDSSLVIVALEPEGVSLKAIEIFARTNRETESILLGERRKSMVATQSLGARELSRKGIADAEGAVASISGVSRQSGVKNVFVRGLGDRYNATLLNGMPVPSEDPEYKNVALTFFGANIIQSISVHKVFAAANSGDGGGAIIDITSKELVSNRSLGFEISQGFNTQTTGMRFLAPAGSGYFGFAHAKKPSPGRFDFENPLDPARVSMLPNQSFSISAGRRLVVRDRPISLYAVVAHSSERAYTKEIVRNMNTSGTVYRDQTGDRYSGKTDQLALLNVNYHIGRGATIAYNFMMLHAATQWVGEYAGRDSEKHQDGHGEHGYVRRQQINDNLLFTHQLLSNWNWSDRLHTVAKLSVNTITGLEPDRRENYLSMKSDGTYGLTGSNRQKRFFSALNEQSYHAKVVVNYKLRDPYNTGKSRISVGYNGQLSAHEFDAVEYNLTAIPGSFSKDHLSLDKLYNAQNFEKGIFQFSEGSPNTYEVSKAIHAAYMEGVYPFAPSFTGNVGLRFDYVAMQVSYNVPGRTDNYHSLVAPYYLPYMHFKYDFGKNNSLRFGVSKTYTLPQSKEISPYQYVHIGFASEGNPDIKPSDNYHFDLRWDRYLSASELLSLAVFYKRIEHPIGRVDKGNSAGLLTYDNISKLANVCGIELEIRKTIFDKKYASGRGDRKLTWGLNASYLNTELILNLTNTPVRKSGLEGASPLLVNTDLTYYYSIGKKQLTSAVVFDYFSDRIFTNGTLGFQDIVERGVPTLDLVTSLRFNKKIGLKLKGANLNNPYFRLTRQSNLSHEKILLSEYRKGIDLSLAASIDL